MGMLRCKPGDVCRYTGRIAELRGYVFVVLRIDESPECQLLPRWYVSPPPPKPSTPGLYVADGTVLDESLTPMRGDADAITTAEPAGVQPVEA